MPLARSRLIVKVASSSNFGSRPATVDCPGSQNLASPLMASPFKARKASAPPSAAIACLTRLLAPFCANDGCAWLMAKSNAAEIDKVYFIAGSSLNLRLKIGVMVLINYFDASSFELEHRPHELLHRLARRIRRGLVSA